MIYVWMHPSGTAIRYTFAESPEEVGEGEFQEVNVRGRGEQDVEDGVIPDDWIRLRPESAKSAKELVSRIVASVEAKSESWSDKALRDMNELDLMFGMAGEVRDPATTDERRVEIARAMAKYFLDDPEESGEVDG